MFENRVLRRIFGPKRDEIRGEWRKLHKEEFNYLYSSPSTFQIEKNEMDGACSTMGERRGVYRILVGKPEGERPLGRSRHRWKDNIKIGLHEVEWRAWSGLIWLRIGAGGGHL